MRIEWNSLTCVSSQELTESNLRMAYFLCSTGFGNSQADTEDGIGPKVGFVRCSVKLV